MSNNVTTWQWIVTTIESIPRHDVDITCHDVDIARHDMGMESGSLGKSDSVAGQGKLSLSLYIKVEEQTVEAEWRKFVHGTNTINTIHSGYD